MSQTQTAEPLTFRVRAGLVIHRRRIVTRNEGRGRSTKSEQIDQFYGMVPTLNQPAVTVDLLPEEVRLHAHALEPTDERSTAALEALHFQPPVKQPDPQELAQSDRIQEMVSAGIMKELLRLGVLTLKAPSAK